MRLLLLASLLVCAGTHAATTYTVTDTGDAGDGTCDATCTLRDAVDAAQADDRIQFDLALTAPLVIGLTGPALQIDVPLRITATDGVRTTIRRTANNGRLMNVVAGGDARVIGLGFENGTAPNGSGFSADGGAVHVAAGGVLELRDCVFRNNTAAGLSNAVNADLGADARGGAIFTAGQLIVDGCAFVGNAARGGNGGISTSAGVPGGNASGGAIHAEGVVDLLNTTFAGNHAVGGNGGAASLLFPPAGNPGLPGGNGGGAAGGALALGPNATATTAFSTLISNDVTPGSGGMGGPGGMAFPSQPPPPSGPNGLTGIPSGAAIASSASVLLNISVIAANAGADQCAGGALLTARTANLVNDTSCPGTLVVALDDQFEAIDPQADSPHYRPKFASAAVDAAPDCLDALAVEPVVLDQRLTARPLAGNGVTPACDFGAIELNPVLFADGFETPPAPL